MWQDMRLYVIVGLHIKVCVLRLGLCRMCMCVLVCANVRVCARGWVRTCVCASVRACVRACVRAGVQACRRAGVRVFVQECDCGVRACASACA